jgi:hypoxanthine phosphoribosyltransferase
LIVNAPSVLPENARVVVSADQIQRRVHEMARQISADYRGRTINAVCVLENGFMFMADLVRVLETRVACQFIKPLFREKPVGNSTSTEIFFTPEVEVGGQHVLLVEGLVQSGVTSEFLLRNLMARGAASVKLAALLDRQAARRVALQPDYFGFLVDESFVFGYGLGDPDMHRNLPYIGTAGRTGAAERGI